MRNVWKGLIVGGLTGVAAGFVLDGLADASKKAVALGDQVLDHAPEAGHWVHSVADKAGGWLNETDVHEQVRAAAHRLKESDAANRVVDMGHDFVSGAREAAGARSD